MEKEPISEERRSFEIALVGAGAVSAGAYTAGVIDFMVQALDEWYALKKTSVGEAVPNHDISLVAFSGASAGAMAATLGVGLLGTDQPPIESDGASRADKDRNRLFSSWVERIDGAELLRCDDLEGADADVTSLLDSTILDKIAQDGLSIDSDAKVRPYLKDPFQLILTVSNLRGIPYAFTLQGSEPRKHAIAMHADYVRFAFSKSGQGPEDSFRIGWSEFGNPSSPSIAHLGQTALASGAFPIGLSPRTLEAILKDTPRHVDPYDSRLWAVPEPESSNPHRCRVDRRIPPDWPLEVGPGYAYRYTCVDGGIMDNEPFELARKILAQGGRNPREGKKADKAVLLIDPFPDPEIRSNEWVNERGLLGTAFRIVYGLVTQTRFKREDLLLAADESVFSRFIVAPSRPGEKYHLAGGCLGTFGGFLKRDFRAHDYFLGRRNAQQFFRRHFVLPEDNSLFDHWDQTVKDDYYVLDPKTSRPETDARGKRFLPILPLVGRSRSVECPAPRWPDCTEEDLRSLDARIRQRLRPLGNKLIDRYLRGRSLLYWMLARAVWWLKRGALRRELIKKVREDLSKRFAFVSP